MSDTQSKMKVAPVGSQRYWESTGQVWIKTHENSAMDSIVSPWIVLPTISQTFLSKFSKLDELGREIFRYKNPIEGDLWLDHEFREFTTRSGKQFNSSEFKKQAKWGGQVGYDFKTVLTNRLVNDKTEFNVYLKGLVEEENETAKLERASEGEGTSKSDIFLTPERIKEIKERARNEFKYDEDTRLTLDDVKDIEDCLSNILFYLKQGTEFTGKEKETYDKGLQLISDLEGTKYISIKDIRTRVGEVTKDFNITFDKAWGVRESFLKKLNQKFSNYIKSHRKEIEDESLQVFLDKTGVDLYSSTSDFYKALRKTLPPPLTIEGASDYYGKVVPDPYNKYRDVILTEIKKAESSSDLYIVSFQDVIRGTNEGTYLSSANLNNYLLEVQKRETDVDVEVPLKLRLSKLFNKELEGTFTQTDIGICEAMEKLSSYLPSGHLLTNEYIQKFRRESTLGSSDNSYAHYSGRDNEIFFSDAAMKSSSQSFSNSELHTGSSELAAVLIHEIGHSVSEKLGRRRNKEYKRFAWECGWSWEQFQYTDPKQNITRNNNFIATGNQPDIKRLGSNASVPLITQYAAKSPEEAFAEFYSFYSQHKNRIDKFLKTKDTSLLEVEKGIKSTPSPTKTFADYEHKHESDEKHFQQMRNILETESRDIQDHIRVNILNPYRDNLENISESSVLPGHIITQKHIRSQNYKEPQPVFSIFDYQSGKHTIVNSDEGIDSHLHYANKYLRRYSPTFTISRECYDKLQDSGFSYTQIRRFALSCVKEQPIPEVRKNNDNTLKESRGLLYRGQLIESRHLEKMSPIFKQMKKIWESDELQKALDELFGIEGDDLEKSLKYEYVTVHPKDRQPYERLQRKRVDEPTTESKIGSTEPISNALSRKLLLNAVKYKGEYYDLSNGDPIFIPKNQRSWVEANIDNKLPSDTWSGMKVGDKELTSKEIDKGTRERFLKVKDLIDKKRELYEIVHSKEEAKHNKIHSLEATKRRVTESLQKIDKESSWEQIENSLSTVRSGFKSSVNPTVIISYKGEEHTRPLDTFIKATKDKKGKQEKANIDSIRIEDFDSYDEEDLSVLKYDRGHEYRHSEAKKKVDKLLEKESINKAFDKITEFNERTKMDNNIEKSELDSFGGVFKSALKTIEKILGKKEEKEDNTPKKYSDVIVRNAKGEILLLERNAYDTFMPSKWGLPGGKVDPGEDFVTAAARELMEETGITIPSQRLIYLRTDILKDGGSIGYFTVQVDGQQQILLDNEEHYRWAWVSLSNISEYDTMFDLGKKLQDFEPELPLIPLIEYSVTSENFEDVLHGRYVPYFKSKFEETGDIDEYYKNLSLVDSKHKEYIDTVVRSNFEKGIINEKEYFNYLSKIK